MLSRSVVSDSVTPWTVAHQALLSVGFTRQEYWSGFPFSPPGDLLDPGIEPTYLGAPALAGIFFTTEPVGKPHISMVGWSLIFRECCEVGASPLNVFRCPSCLKLLGLLSL